MAPAKQPPVAFSGLSRSAPPPACVLGIDDLRRLYVDLDRKASQALEQFLAAQVRNPGTSEAEFEQLKQQARDAGHVTVTISGGSGELLVARSADVFGKDYLPHRLVTVAYDTTSGLQSLNVTLPNRMNVHLDFSEPRGLPFTIRGTSRHPTAHVLRRLGPTTRGYPLPFRKSSISSNAVAAIDDGCMERVPSISSTGLSVFLALFGQRSVSINCC